MDTIDRECLPGARTCALSTRVQQCQQGALAGSGPMVTKSRTPPISSTSHIVSPSECFRPFRQGAECTSIKAPVTGFLFLSDFQYPNILCNAVRELYNYEGLNREYHTPLRSFFGSVGFQKPTLPDPSAALCAKVYGEVVGLGTGPKHI